MSEGKHEQQDNLESAPTPEEARALREKIELLIERAKIESDRGGGEAHHHLMNGLWHALEGFMWMERQPDKSGITHLYGSGEKSAALLERYFNILDKYPDQAEVFRNQPISAYPYLRAMMVARDEEKGDKSETEAWIDEIERRLTEDGKL